MRRTYLYRIVVSAIVFLTMNPGSFSQTGIIIGKVRHDGEVLQGATVSLGNKTMLTDRNGEFYFSIEQGSYKLIITHVGYKKIELEITVDADTTKDFDLNMIPFEQMGEIVVLGSRSLIHRSNLNTPVPVDAFSSSQLQQTGQTSLMQMLNFVAPSVNASLPFVAEPITLRGLYPDQTLLLLNGTRYNNIAYINPGLPRGQLGKGSVGNDLTTIPFSAIEKIEILRDGASAQYGSDAVAGVVNIILKETTGKTAANLHLGQFYEGDGENISMGIYHGFDLRKKGFLNFSGDFLFRNPTYRGGEHTGTVYKNYSPNSTHGDSVSVKLIDDSIVRARNFDRMNVGNAGNTKSISCGVLMNGAYSFNNKIKLFWTGAVNNRPIFFVSPYTLPKNASLVNTDLFPDGFKGTTKLNAWNLSGIAGARGVAGKEIQWEYSSAYGLNSEEFISKNVNNASQQYSLGKNAPTTFYAGTLIYQQLTNSLHFTRNIFSPQKKLKTINVSWGAELRFENFGMKAGEEASWKNYDSMFKKQAGLPASQVVSPDDVVNKNRSIQGAYIDVETEYNDRLLINLASRFEHYSDFGSNLAGKLAARYKLSDKLSVRASVSNGFRAPSMQQRYWGAIVVGSSKIIGGVLTPATSGLFNNDHKVSKLFGVPPLEAERSVNLGGGLTSTLSRNIYLTIDAYWIQVKNRIVISGYFNRTTNHEVDSLLSDPSLGDYRYIDRVQFFSNAINTRTKGIDIVTHGNWNIHKAQLIAIIAANFTKTSQFGEIKTAANLSATSDNQNTLFNEEARTNLESGQPRDKIMISLNYKWNHIGFMLRNTHFGKTAFQYLGNPKETFSSKILTDLSISYTPKSWLTLTAGANNIFDVYPDRIENEKNTYEGRNIYAMDASQFGYNGGYYFVAMSFNFE